MKIDLRLTFHYGLTIFLSAFLLFQVQPLIGKMILPWFGGSAAVWTTCMLFFQSILLLGYFYAHGLVRYLSPSRQSLLHGSLLLISLLLIPISPSLDWKPVGAENPTLQILGLLTVSIGLPYFVLSNPLAVLSLVGFVCRLCGCLRALGLARSPRCLQRPVSPARWPCAALVRQSTVGCLGSMPLYFDGGRHQLPHRQHCTDSHDLGCTFGSVFALVHFEL
jgi:hypothetical protein